LAKQKAQATLPGEKFQPSQKVAAVAAALKWLSNRCGNETQRDMTFAI
jgi:hypothetical protein